MARLTNYNTRQRELILEYLRINKDGHVTANQIIQYLKENNTPVGKSTVYRYLDLLLEKDMIRKYTLENGKRACYQYIDDVERCKHHFHLKCVKCGELFHVTCEVLDNVKNHILTDHGFLIDSSRTVYYGICRECQGKLQIKEEKTDGKNVN